MTRMQQIGEGLNVAIQPKGINVKRYYLSEIFLDPGPPQAWRHRFQAATSDIEYKGGEIAVDPVTGIPTQKALLILVGAINHGPFAAIPGLVALPDVASDTKVSSIHTSTKLQTIAKIKALGLGAAATDAAWGNADGLRDVLNHYGRLNNPSFDCNNFDLTDF